MPAREIARPMNRRARNELRNSVLEQSKIRVNNMTSVPAIPPQSTHQPMAQLEKAESGQITPTVASPLMMTPTGSLQTFMSINDKTEDGSGLVQTYTTDTAEEPSPKYCIAERSRPVHAHAQCALTKIPCLRQHMSGRSCSLDSSPVHDALAQKDALASKINLRCNNRKNNIVSGIADNSDYTCVLDEERSAISSTSFSTDVTASESFSSLFEASSNSPLSRVFKGPTISDDEQFSLSLYSRRCNDSFYSPLAIESPVNTCDPPLSGHDDHHARAVFLPEGKGLEVPDGSPQWGHKILQTSLSTIESVSSEDLHVPA